MPKRNKNRTPPEKAGSGAAGDARSAAGKMRDGKPAVLSSLGRVSALPNGLFSVFGGDCFF